jgi:hypothetical protein
MHSAFNLLRSLPFSLCCVRHLQDLGIKCIRGEPCAQEDSGGDGEAPPAGGALGAPARHHYPALTIVATLQLYLHTGLASRGVRRVLERVAPWPAPQAPGSSTVFNWLYRCGLALLQQAPERCGDWIYVIDHTLGLGETKCLVILGIPVRRLAACGYSPPQQAMQVLAVEVTSHSTGTWVAEVLAQTSARTGVPVQIVADHGSDLSKGIALFRQAHAPAAVVTYDISHRHAAQSRTAPGCALECLSGALSHEPAHASANRSGLSAAPAPTHQGPLHARRRPYPVGATPARLL